MSWKECKVSLDVEKLLSRFFDPLEDFTATEYLELARSLLELYRCEKLPRIKERKPEEVDDTLLMLGSLVELSAKTLIEKYYRHEYREKLRESLKTLGESEINMLNEYLKLGIQLVGYNLTPLLPFLSDKLFLQYFGSILKLLAIIVVGVKKYWAKRTIRKFSVNIERLARKFVEELGRYSEMSETGKIEDIVKKITRPDSLMKLTEKLYREQVYANTPEIIAFAKELQELRKEWLKAR